MLLLLGVLVLVPCVERVRRDGLRTMAASLEEVAGRGVRTEERRGGRGLDEGAQAGRSSGGRAERAARRAGRGQAQAAERARAKRPRSGQPHRSMHPHRLTRPRPPPREPALKSTSPTQVLPPSICSHPLPLFCARLSNTRKRMRGRLVMRLSASNASLEGLRSGSGSWARARLSSLTRARPLLVKAAHSSSSSLAPTAPRVKEMRGRESATVLSLPASGPGFMPDVRSLASPCWPRRDETAFGACARKGAVWGLGLPVWARGLFVDVAARSLPSANTIDHRHHQPRYPIRPYTDTPPWSVHSRSSWLPPLSTI